MEKHSHLVVNVLELKILNFRDRHSLKRLVEGVPRKSVQLLTKMFNEGPKNISARSMHREVKEMVRGVVPLSGNHWLVNRTEKNSLI